MEPKDAPATKADLSAMKEDLTMLVREEVSGVRQELRGEIAATIERIDGVEEKIEMLRTETGHQYRELAEQMRGGQTELLKAFYNFATSNEKQVNQLESDDAAIRGRLSALESRMLEVEKRLNMPPAA